MRYNNIAAHDSQTGGGSGGKSKKVSEGCDEVRMKPFPA